MPTVNYIGNMPSIYVDLATYRQWFMLGEIAHDESKSEISWFSFVERSDDNTFYIYGDPVVPEQQVHSTTTEVSSEDMSKMIHEVMDNEEQDHTQLRVWGHSHGSMGVTPSGQDTTQAKEYLKDYGGIFICIITNIKGQIRVDLYDADKGISITDLPIQFYVNNEQELYDRCEALHKERVKKFVYQQPPYGGHHHNKKNLPVPAQPSGNQNGSPSSNPVDNINDSEQLVAHYMTLVEQAITFEPAYWSFAWTDDEITFYDLEMKPIAEIPVDYITYQEWMMICARIRQVMPVSSQLLLDWDDTSAYSSRDRRYY